MKIKKPCKNCGADNAVNVALAEHGTGVYKATDGTEIFIGTASTNIKKLKIKFVRPEYYTTNVFLCTLGGGSRVITFIVTVFRKGANDVPLVKLNVLSNLNYAESSYPTVEAINATSIYLDFSNCSYSNLRLFIKSLNQDDIPALEIVTTTTQSDYVNPDNELS